MKKSKPSGRQVWWKIKSILQLSLEAAHWKRSADGLLTLAGGKLTDYRKMAEGAMKMIQTILAEEYQKEFTLIDSKKLSSFRRKIEPKR